MAIDRRQDASVVSGGSISPTACSATRRMKESGHPKGTSQTSLNGPADEVGERLIVCAGTDVLHDELSVVADFSDARPSCLCRQINSPEDHVVSLASHASDYSPLSMYSAAEPDVSRRQGGAIRPKNWIEPLFPSQRCFRASAYFSEISIGSEKIPPSKVSRSGLTSSGTSKTSTPSAVLPGLISSRNRREFSST